MLDYETPYRTDIDTADEAEWNAQLRLFDDATVYQTWAFGRMKAGNHGLHHIRLWHLDNLVAMCQVRIMRLRFSPLAVAYAHWGPLWIHRDTGMSFEHLRRILSVLRDEYVGRRKMILRISPKVVDCDRHEEIRAVFNEKGFTWSPDPGQTFFVDLSAPLETVKARLHRDWRRDLRNAEKQALLLTYGTSVDDLTIAINLVREMKDRKKYFGTGSVDLLAMQRDLPEDIKIILLIAHSQGEPIAALGWQTLGKIGIPVIAATGNKGLKLKASFLLWWKMIEYYHERGFRCLDVGGVHASRNPGGFLFKSRLTGKNKPQPDRYFGDFTACRGKIFPALFKVAYLAQKSYRHVRARTALVLHAGFVRFKSNKGPRE